MKLWIAALIVGIAALAGGYVMGSGSDASEPDSPDAVTSRVDDLTLSDEPPSIVGLARVDRLSGLRPPVDEGPPAEEPPAEEPSDGTGEITPPSEEQPPPTDTTEEEGVRKGGG